MRGRPVLVATRPAHAGAPACPATPARFLAALRRRSYLAVSLAVMAGACARTPAPLAPTGAWVPMRAEAFAAMAAGTVPTVAQLIRVHWTYDDGNQESSGRGAARLAPPDSLRLDVAVPVMGRATLVLAGDSSWSQPDQLAEQVPRSRALLWALFGIIRPQHALTRIETGDAPGRRLYRLTAPDGLVTQLECRGDTLLAATELRGDRIVGRLALTRDSAGAVVKADASDVEHGVRFVVEVNHREASEPFPAEIWRRP